MLPNLNVVLSEQLKARDELKAGQLCKLTLLSCLALSALGLSPVAAADKPVKGAPLSQPAEPELCLETSEIPTDAFGFGAGSDVATLGSWGMGLEGTSAFGTRLARLQSYGLKAQVSTSFVNCFEIGPSLSGGVSRLRSKIGDPTVEGSAFGGAVELKYKLLGRAQHGVGLTIGIEPGIGTAREDDGLSAITSTSFSNQTKILMDAVLIPEKLFMNVNIFHDAAWLGNSSYARSSVLTLSSALAVQVQKDLFLGIEGRHLRSYDGIALNSNTGHAWFLGPTFFWKASESLSVSGTYSYQIAGQAVGDSRALDLVNFNRHQAKVKLGFAF
jgi:hypothetical protein